LEPDWRTRNSIVDPRESHEPVLELKHVVPVVFRGSRFGAGSLEVLDEARLRVRTVQLEDHPLKFDLIPGEYLFRATGTDGALEERTVEVGPEGCEVRLDG
jgi:hypothetical protein